MKKDNRPIYLSDQFSMVAIHGQIDCVTKHFR